jgi:hypothetical protein
VATGIALAVALWIGLSGDEPEQTLASKIAEYEQKVASSDVPVAEEKHTPASQWDASQDGEGSASDLFFFVRSENVHHDQVLALELKEQLVEAGIRSSNVILQHVCADEWEASKEGPPFHVDYWTLTPLLIQLDAKLQARAGPAPKWVVFLEPNTRVDVPKLRTTLAGYDHTKPMLVGHILKDLEHSIVHFFESGPYPFIKAGCALSTATISAVGSSIQETPLPVDSHTDPIYQWASYLHKTKGVKAEFENRTDVFCATDASGASGASSACATTIVTKEPHRRSHGVRPEDVVIAVKVYAEPSYAIIRSIIR